jgi:hypothetical protein
VAQFDVEAAELLRDTWLLYVKKRSVVFYLWGAGVSVEEIALVVSMNQ